MHGFWSACRSGDLGAAKRVLLEVGAVNIDVHQAVFNITCAEGHLEVAKWLWFLGVETQSPIDIHAYQESAFRCVCAYGHLHVAKWLWGLETGTRIDIHARHDEAFSWACRHNHLDLARWLWSLEIDTEYAWPPVYKDKVKTWSETRGVWVLVSVLGVHPHPRA